MQYNSIQGLKIGQTTIVPSGTYLQSPLIYAARIFNLDHKPCINELVPCIIICLKVLVYQFKLEKSRRKSEAEQNQKFSITNTLEQHAPNHITKDFNFGTVALGTI